VKLPAFGFEVEYSIFVNEEKINEIIKKYKDAIELGLIGKEDKVSLINKSLFPELDNDFVKKSFHENFELKEEHDINYLLQNGCLIGIEITQKGPKNYEETRNNIKGLENIINNFGCSLIDNEGITKYVLLEQLTYEPAFHIHLNLYKPDFDKLDLKTANFLFNFFHYKGNWEFLKRISGRANFDVSSKKRYDSLRIESYQEELLRKFMKETVNELSYNLNNNIPFELKRYDFVATYKPYRASLEIRLFGSSINSDDLVNRFDFVKNLILFYGKVPEGKSQNYYNSVIHYKTLEKEGLINF